MFRRKNHLFNRVCAPMLGSCVFGNVALVIDRFDISSSCRKLNLDTVWIRFMIYLAGANMRAENVQQNSQTAEQ